MPQLKRILHVIDSFDLGPVGNFAVSAGASLRVESDFSFASGANLTGAGSVTFAAGHSD